MSNGINMYSMTNEDREVDACHIKDIVLDYLWKEGIISQEQNEELSASLCIVIRAPKKLSWFAKHIMGKEISESIMIHTAKISVIKNTLEQNRKDEAEANDDSDSTDN